MDAGNCKSTPDSDEDDYENYFLQPARSPYNIIEKVKEANTVLFAEELVSDYKQPKVKFKAELVDYEPEPSEDEATNSIESEERIDYSLIEEETSMLETQLQSALILNVCNTDDEEELGDEIVEEIEGGDVTPTVLNQKVKFDVECANVHIIKQVSELQSEINNNNEIRTRKFPKKNLKVDDISCKRHCIDSVDRFDFNANISVCKIDLREKLYQCPRLKLQRRNCCEQNELKAQQKLPSYTGLRSEYGLTAAQLERRERRNEILKLQKLERQRMLEENKRRRYQQNEHVFCEWLKSVSNRKAQALQKKIDKARQPLSSTIITFPHSAALGERPKTANEIFSKHCVRKKKKRPHTSSTCIFIELPPNVLQKGVNIGDLLVNKSKIASKKLHVLTMT